MTPAEKSTPAATPLACAINPSSRLLLSMQVQGLSDALRFALQAGQKPGPLTIKLYNQLREDAAKHAEGDAIARLPVADEKTTPVDLLSAAEVLRTTLAACLTPEEHETRERIIGFSAGKPIE